MRRRRARGERTGVDDDVWLFGCLVVWLFGWLVGCRSGMIKVI